MAFFPLVSLLDTEGYCTIHNFPSNNWEKSDKDHKTVWALYSNGNQWVSKSLGLIKTGKSKTFYYKDLGLSYSGLCSPIVFLQLRKTPLPQYLDQLPDQEITLTKVPQWRATVGFSLNQAQTSYQGEINPFPKKASLLTFHPFIQYNTIRNYFVFFNLEKSPIFRKGTIEIYNSYSKKFIDKIEVRTCYASVIEIDQYNFDKDDLPVFISRDMAGIPFGFGIAEDKTMLSLEHTHPPASFVVHGERFRVQNELKKQWFSKLTMK